MYRHNAIKQILVTQANSIIQLLMQGCHASLCNKRLVLHKDLYVYQMLIVTVPAGAAQFASQRSAAANEPDTLLLGKNEAFGWQVKVQRRQEALQVELEQCGEDMDKMAELLDEMEELNKNATDLDMTLLDRNIDKMMPELGFSPDDNDQLVAAYRCVVLPQCCCVGTCV